MATRLKPNAKKLTDEFQEKLSLSQVDSLRAAFVVFALKAGWPKARIARYLGVFRQRIDQRERKYVKYAADTKNFPTLHAALAERAPVNRGANQPLVGFDQAKWNDLEFAREMVNRVAPK